MYLNNFSVRIPEGVDLSGYVEMRHDTQYTLVLRNNHSVRCDAQVEIDGKYVGAWRLQPHSSFRLERPAHDPGRFTFYKMGTREAEEAALFSGNPNVGLVKVTFTPEKEMKVKVRPLVTGTIWKGSYPKDVIRAYTNDFPGTTAVCSASAATRSAGGTGLSGESGQHFVDAPYIDRDFSQQTVIHLRLVCKDGDPRPLTSFSTPVPPPVY